MTNMTDTTVTPDHTATGDTTTPTAAPTDLSDSMHPALRLPDTGTATPWIGLDDMPARPEEFSFVLLSDRTGLARPGVFEHAVSITNLMRPDFALQVGDLIEGYTDDPDELARQWAHMDTVTAELDVPLFHVPGNHDVSNQMMRDEWIRRFGVLNYHFVYHDTLFVVLDTQDPPQRHEDFTDRVDSDVEDRIARLKELQATDPEAAVELIETMTDWNGTMPANVSEEQLAWVNDVLAAHSDVRWTVVCMHMPIWQEGEEEHPAFTAIRRSLGDRPHTMFAGHVHNYRHTVIDGHDHIRLGPTGGLWVLSGDDGNFDHITWVTMTTNGPRVANIVLDAVLPVEGGTYSPQPRFAPTPA